VKVSDGIIYIERRSSGKKTALQLKRINNWLENKIIPGF